MEIKVEEGLSKPYLPNGRHVVEITEVQEGKSEHKGVPFFSCKFENEKGFITSRFYNTDPGMPIIIDLFQTVGVEVEEGKKIDTGDLLNKKLSIVVGDRSYEDPSGKEKTVKVASDFKRAEEAETSDAARK